MDLPELSAELEAGDDFGSGGPLELNEANVVAVQDQLKVPTHSQPPSTHTHRLSLVASQAEIDSLKKWLDQCGQQVPVMERPPGTQGVLHSGCGPLS